MNQEGFLKICMVAVLSLACSLVIAQELDMSVVSEESSSRGVDIDDLRESSTEVFEQLDENHSGSITRDEIDISLTDEELAQMVPQELRQWDRRRMEIYKKFFREDIEVSEFEVADKDNDGVLNKEEYGARDTTIENYKVELGWKELDTDSSGSVELVEFNGFLDDFEQYDEDNDGILSYEEAKNSNDQEILRVVRARQNSYVYTYLDNSAQRIQRAKERVKKNNEGKK
ncbi:MAG: hypothetical protein F4Z87_07220 [Gammaproteobacteria bacterium]|nr:hypothetical protein [Gammaproteobacteria bacterium]